MKVICLVVTTSKGGNFQDAQPYTGLKQALRVAGLEERYDIIARIIRDEGVYIDDTHHESNKYYFRKPVVKAPYQQKITIANVR